MLLFTCDKKKICLSIKLSPNIMNIVIDFWNKVFAPPLGKIGKIWVKKLGFLKLIERFGHQFFWVYFVIKHYIIRCGPEQIHICEKSRLWYMGQNVLSQYDYKNFNSAISLKQNDVIAWFFAFWYIFMKIERWLKCILRKGLKCGYKWV